MTIKSRQSKIVIQTFGDETIIYDLTTNKTFLLNETAAFVWKSLDGSTDVKTVAFNLAHKTKGTMNEEIVWLAIESLKNDNLLETSSIQSPLQGIDRRKVIKRIGLATMIALPFISSIVAPKAANAASSGACVGFQSGVCIDNGNFTQSNCCTNLRCVFDECLNCRTSADLPYVQFNSLAECQSAPARNFCCNPSAPVTFVPANPPFSTVGSCFCG